MTFPRTVNNAPGLAVPGDFAGTNPRASVISGPGQYVAPASGLTVGNFAWAAADAGPVSQSYVAGDQVGLLGRNLQAVITAFLGEASMLVNPGIPVTLFNEGDFWTKFAAGATPGQRVYADPSTGAPVAGGATAPAVASVTADAGVSVTASVGASFTIVIATNVATLSAVTGYVTAGDLVTGAGIAGAAIGAQLTGTAGGAGTYTFVHADISSEAATSTSTVLNVTAVLRGLLVIGSVVTGGGLAGGSAVTAIITGTGGVGRYTLSGAAQSSVSGTKLSSNSTLNVTAVGSGVLGVGSLLSGSGVTAGTTITSQLTGTTGGIGTYGLSVAQNFASTTVSELGVATPFYVMSTAGNNELAKISSW